MTDVFQAGTVPDTAPYDEIGRDPGADGLFDHCGADVVGVCERCGHQIHEGVVGHGCEDGYREHRDGEGIEPVPEVSA